MSTMKRRFDQGKKRKENPLYRRYCYQIRRLRGKWDSLKGKEEGKHELQRIQQEIRRVDRLRKQLPSGDPFDDGYKRLYFCRYADDFCIGIIGSRADAEQIRQEVRQFSEKDPAQARMDLANESFENPGEQAQNRRKQGCQTTQDARGSQAHCQRRARDTLHQGLSPERPQKTSTARLSTRCPTQWIRLDAELLRSHQTAQQEAMRVL